MSKLSKLLEKLGGVEAGDWKAQADRVDVDLVDISFNLGESVSERAVVIDAIYRGADGVEHAVQVETRFQKDDHDSVEWDGEVMENAYIDTDVMGEFGKVRFQLECRYNNPDDVDDSPATGDNQKHFNPGGGNHEFRVMRSLELGDAGEFGNLAKLLAESV